jgi:hypothetical protein
VLLYHLFALVSTKNPQFEFNFQIETFAEQETLPLFSISECRRFGAINSTPVVLTKSERRWSEDAWKDPEEFSSAMLPQGILTKQLASTSFRADNQTLLCQPISMCNCVTAFSRICDCAGSCPALSTCFPNNTSVRARLERLSRSERSEQGMRSRAVQAAAETIPCCRRLERSASGATKQMA